MENNRKIFVEKKKGFDVEAKKIYDDLKSNLKIPGLEKVRVINKYLVSNIDQKTFDKSLTTVFSEPPVDNVYLEEFPKNKNDIVFGVELLPGQFDQRADSASQCLKLINPKVDCPVIFTRVIVLCGKISQQDVIKIKKYIINPIETHEVDINSLTSRTINESKNVIDKTIKKFTSFNKKQLEKFHIENKLAMNLEDLEFVKNYFKRIKRNPSITEIKVIDTYWSDHCRHTTFESRIQSIKIESSKYTSPIKKSYEGYIKLRESLFGEKTKRKISLMDLATICAKEMKKQGYLNDLDISDEINACSIVVDVDLGKKTEKYLLMFKNETHNHPTEIEPFGGASTCLGGAIRDPLSGRTYVYQAMRVTGSGDPTKPISETLPNKLPQKITTTAAANGYAAYGNQIGLTTGQVDEIYHKGYIAKRMEVGAVIAAAPKKNIVRKKLKTGDVVLLVGAETGKDGVGGATGSSKKHSKTSSVDCGAEVQKGNPVCERKIQRLFRRREVSRLIKKCNDFGAGGVSVAVGELARGLDIHLDKVPLKYPGLNVTEIALSESQERMAVVVSKINANRFIRFAKQENLAATKIATISNKDKLRMYWKDKLVVDIDRSFLDTNGVEQKTNVVVKAPKPIKQKTRITNIKKQWKEMVVDLNCCSKLGMIQKFDSTIGKNTILMPLGGKYQMTPAEGMVAKIPTFGKETNTVSLMTYGFNPYIGEWSPYHMGYYAVIESITKMVALGGDPNKIRLTFQEYFEKLGKDSAKWGKPFAALLGAFEVQKSLNLAAIGGKDSMSGTYEKLCVPPTLISFAVATGNAENIISPEFKRIGSIVAIIKTKKHDDGTIDLEQFKLTMETIHKSIVDGKIISAFSLKHKGIAEAVTKMSFGNQIGIRMDDISLTELFDQDYGSMVVEIAQECDHSNFLKQFKSKIIGRTISQPEIQIKNYQLKIDELEKITLSKLENVFRFDSKEPEAKTKIKTSKSKATPTAKKYVKKPLVVIPVFPGTNCEFDSQSSWEKAGAKVKQVMILNLNTKMLERSIRKLVSTIKKANIIMIPGGFSGGDEPDGSAKFIVNVFQNPSVKKATTDLLNKRDGLMIGICNGFQALIKLGLLPFGEIKETNESMPTLTYNSIHHHMSQLVRTKIVSNKSPWLAGTKVNEVYTLPISHGEGKFYASEEIVKQLEKNGQIVAQYVDLDGQPTMKMPHNPNGSVYAIESITSPDGRILGKMAHSERIGKNLYKNVPGVFDQKLFENGVKYFHRGK